MKRKQLIYFTSPHDISIFFTVFIFQKKQVFSKPG